MTSLVAVPEGTRPLVVFSYARGVPLAWTETQSQLAGRLLASIHTAADDFVSRHTRADLDLDYLVDRPLRTLRRFLMHRPDDWVYLETLAERLRRSVSGLREHLRWGVCHGDFGAKNIHTDEAHTLTVFDFDRCGPGWRAFDFALVMWAATGRKRKDIWHSFLRGYQETRILGAADLEAVPLFHALAQLSGLGLIAKHADTFGRLRIDDVNLDAWLTFFRRWEMEQATPTFLPAS
jgi:Ser/Thr protein kinase RdoA (MazF antagonist)